MRREVVLWCIFILSGVIQLHAGSTYYVDARTGSDQNSGLSASTPWRTIAKANSELRPGDRVYLGGGTYSETIAPSRSGTSTEVIIYQKYGTDDAIIAYVRSGVVLNNKSHIIIAGVKIINVGRFVVISDNSQYNVIQNCHLEGAFDWGGVRIENSSHNKILDNYIYNGHGDLVELYPNADHNLIEGNEIFGGPLNTHSCLLIRSTETQDYSSYNIVRDNYIHGAYHDNVNVLQKVDRNLFEGNIIEGVPQGAGAKFCGGQNNIFRKNIVIDCKAYGFGIYTSLYGGYESYGADNVFYHNIAYRSNRGKGMDGGIRFIVYRDGGEIQKNAVKNNIFMDNAPQQIYIGAVEGFRNRVGSNTFSSNIAFSGKRRHRVIKYLNVRYTIKKIESLRESGFFANLAVDPRFVHAKSKNFRLRADSPALDRGAFLTRTTSAGNGTQIRVEDARYFCDGFGVMEGDLIQLQGQTRTVRILDVDYANNVITTDTVFAWTNGQGVSLPYSGSAPDIGVYEFGLPTPLSMR